jgi:hypothetical protein
VEEGKAEKKERAERAERAEMVVTMAKGGVVAIAEREEEEATRVVGMAGQNREGHSGSR